MATPPSSTAYSPARNSLPGRQHQRGSLQGRAAGGHPASCGGARAGARDHGALHAGGRAQLRREGGGVGRQAQHLDVGAGVHREVPDRSPGLARLLHRPHRRQGGRPPVEDGAARPPWRWRACAERSARPPGRAGRGRGRRWPPGRRPGRARPRRARPGRRGRWRRCAPWPRWSRSPWGRVRSPPPPAGRPRPPERAGGGRWRRRRRSAARRHLDEARRGSSARPNPSPAGPGPTARRAAARGPPPGWRPDRARRTPRPRRPARRRWGRCCWVDTSAAADRPAALPHQIEETRDPAAKTGIGGRPVEQHPVAAGRRCVPIEAHPGGGAELGQRERQAARRPAG